MRPVASSPRGTVSLVALCFIAVLGLVLASYIAVCSRSMQLSNRTFQASVSQQLAEFGLEEGLRAFNRNDWAGWASNPSGMSGGTSAWTIDSTNKRASRTITIDATKLGQGATATIKIRVDNYDASQLDSGWNSTVTYRPGSIVGYSGMWYRATTVNSGKTPSLTSTYWVSDMGTTSANSMSWRLGSSYVAGNMTMSSGGTIYRCYTNHTATATDQPGVGTSWTSYWTEVPYFSIDADLHYTNESIVNYYGNWYRYNGGWDGPLPSGTWSCAWRWSSGVTYTKGDVVYDGYPSYGGWYRYINSSNTSGNAITNTSYWRTAANDSASAGAAAAWSATYNYNPGDVVYSSSAWYRCVQANLNKTPSSNPLFWSTNPQYSTLWDASRQYSQNDLVRYKGVWYYCRSGNFNQTPPTTTPYYDSYWASAADTTRQWSPTGSYTANTSYVNYDGVWYRCVTSNNSGPSPNNSTYWTPTWANSYGVTTGAPVIYVEASVTAINSPALRTQIRAVIDLAPLYPNAAAASSILTINGASGTVDSYDSTSSLAYTSQIGTATNYSAVLSAGSTIAINGNTAIKGYLAWPSPAGGISTGTTVKSATSPALPNLDPTRVSRSPFVPQFDIQPAGGLVTNWNTVPKGSALPTGTTVDIGMAGAITPARYYYSGPLTMGGGSSVVQILNINGPVILYISGDLTMTGGPNSSIVINSGGSAEIHVGGGLKADSGSDGIINKTADPRKLTILCDSTGTVAQYYNEGGNFFYGTIYAPKTTATGGFYFNYGDTNYTKIYGAVSAANITYNNRAELHYDTSLRYAPTPGVDQPYAVTEWRELSVTEQATMP